MCQHFRYSHLKKTDLFTFFNLSEINTIICGSNDQLTRIQLKTGGFQEHIDIEFTIENDIIYNALLVLDRSWIGDEQSINPFAKDIVKSFLQVLMPDALDNEFKIELVQGLWNMTGSKDRVICLDEVVHRWEDSNPIVKEFLDLFRGIRSFKFRTMGDFTILMENRMDKETKKDRFFLTLSWKK